MGRIAVRLMLSMDTSAAFLNYVFISVIFGRQFDLLFVGLSALCCHLGNIIDVILYLISRKRRRSDDQQIFFHPPIWLIPLVGAASYFLFCRMEPESLYPAAIAVSGTVWRFIYDSFGLPRINRGSPFVKTKFAPLFNSGGRRRKAPDQIADDFYVQVRKKLNNGAYGFADELFVRTDIVSDRDIVLNAASFYLLANYALFGDLILNILWR